MANEKGILVTGCCRSGTSLIAGVVHLCGAFGGLMSNGRHTNMQGFFENTIIKNRIVTPYLKELRADINGHYPLPDSNHLEGVGDWQKQVLNSLTEQGYREGSPWMFKDGRTLLLFPIWVAAFPDIKWVVVRRNKQDIIQSCVKTGFMQTMKQKNTLKQLNVLTEEQGWDWMVEQYLNRIESLTKLPIQYREIYPEHMVNGDYSQLVDLVSWLGLKWNSKALTFIDSKLNGRRK